MTILSIDTSCDDTCISIVECRKNNYKILANIVSSQIKIHSKYGGVVPHLAKREHQKNLIPVLEMALKKSKIKSYGFINIENKKAKIEEILIRDPLLFKKLISFCKKYPYIPKIDVIAVTIGPGLEPCLWSGINLAKALSYLWKKPLIGINHIEGHIAANWAMPIRINLKSLFPAMCLVVSGGHTQLILMKDYLKYKLIGETKDDAAGEAFDKISKLLGLSYPGGPIIEKLAKKGNPNAFNLPRPMINQKNYNFSFSGLKTAVLYLLKEISESEQPPFLLGAAPKSRKLLQDICASFQQAVIDVLIEKTINAGKEYKVKSIILGGGVASNRTFIKQFKQKISPKINFFVPPKNLCTDNATMIAIAGCWRVNKKYLQRKTISKIKANSNLKIA